jgi:hypothetical protein
VRRKAIITSASFYWRRFNAAVCWRTSRYGRDGMQALVFRYTAWHSGSRTRKLVLGRMALWVSHQKATRFLVVLPFPSPIGFFVSAGIRAIASPGKKESQPTTLWPQVAVTVRGRDGWMGLLGWWGVVSVFVVLRWGPSGSSVRGHAGRRVPPSDACGDLTVLH